MAEWATIAIADTYFTTRAGDAITVWPALTDANKQGYLTTSYNRIYHDTQWSVPTAPTAAQLVKLQMAQCELAWYMYTHINDEDRRKGLQAQAVVEAGVVKESYLENDIHSVSYPPIILKLLDGFNVYGPFAMTEIGRDENKELDDDSVVN